MKLSKHFDSEEFRCHDGSPLPANFATTISDTVDFLERLRIHMNNWLAANVPEFGGKNPDLGIIVLSGHRSLKYNRRIGSSDTSQHVAGKAADIVPSRMYRFFTYAQWYKMCEEVAKSYMPPVSSKESARPYRLGKYNRSKFVHVDCGYGHGGLRWTGN